MISAVQYKISKTHRFCPPAAVAEGSANPFMSLLKSRLRSTQKHRFARAARAAGAKLQQPQQDDQSGSQWPALAYLGRILRQ
jgi:hypothetical protein